MDYLVNIIGIKHLKTNGFNIEDINLKIDDKIELMMGVLAMVYIIAVREGLLSHRLKPIPVKKYKDGTIYLSISIFRMGLAIIQNLFTKINQLIEYIQIRLKDFVGWHSVKLENSILTKSV